MLDSEELESVSDSELVSELLLLLLLLELRLMFEISLPSPSLTIPLSKDGKGGGVGLDSFFTLICFSSCSVDLREAPSPRFCFILFARILTGGFVKARLVLLISFSLSLSLSLSFSLSSSEDEPLD